MYADVPAAAIFACVTNAARSIGNASWKREGCFLAHP
jgi:hypothetical protein